jgi:glycosyltransferase involved in cell wall biosynthesis
MRRVLFVLEYYYPHIGGVETLFAHLAESLAARGHAVTVVTLHLPGAKARERHNGVEIIRIKAPQRGRRYLFMLLALPTVLRVGRTADVIHTTTYNAAVPAWVCSLAWAKPAVITVHEVFAEQWNNLPGLDRWLGYGFRFFEWLVLRLPFAHYVCDSEFTRGRLVGRLAVPPERASVVYPAIDYEFWDRRRHAARDLKAQLGLPGDGFVYLYFGRPGISKGIEYLIDAVPLIRQRRPGSRLVLLLSKDPRGQYDRILRQVDALKVGDSVTVLDPVPRGELPGYLLGADRVVVPSVSEGFGYAAAEAALLGCRVVATAGHAVEEVLGDAVRRVPARDPAALADAILSAGEGGRLPAAVPRHYTVENHIAAVEGVYRRLRKRPHARQTGEGGARQRPTESKT